MLGVVENHPLLFLVVWLSLLIVDLWVELMELECLNEAALLECLVEVSLGVEEFWVGFEVFQSVEGLEVVVEQILMLWLSRDLLTLQS